MLKTKAQNSFKIIQVRPSIYMQCQIRNTVVFLELLEIVLQL